MSEPKFIEMARELLGCMPEDSDFYDRDMATLLRGMRRLIEHYEWKKREYHEND